LLNGSYTDRHNGIAIVHCAVSATLSSLTFALLFNSFVHKAGIIGMLRLHYAGVTDALHNKVFFRFISPGKDLVVSHQHTMYHALISHRITTRQKDMRNIRVDE